MKMENKHVTKVREINYAHVKSPVFNLITGLPTADCRYADI